MDGGRADNGTKGLKKINSFMLVKSLSDKACLVALYSAIRFAFDLKDPLAPDNIHGWIKRNKSPCLVVSERINFLSHGMTPLRVSIGLFEG